MLQNLYWANPVAAFSVGDEKKVGEQLLTMVRKEFKLLDEPDIIQYINELGSSTLAVAGSQYFDYHFFIISNKELNAFAAPSGLIFFHSGLIESLETEGELVGVVAHEIGHVVSRHLADRISKNAKISAATTLGVLLGIAIGAGPLSEALISGSVAAGQTASLSFSRLDEEEADRLAFRWMQDQKRDPAVMVNMLRKIHNANRYRQGHIPPYLLTHPGPDIRMSYIQDLTLFSEKKPFVQVDEFPFQRFKSRIISMTKDPIQTINYYQNMVSTLEPGSYEAAMAYYILSQAYLAAANFTKAESELRKAMAYFPDRNILMADMGLIYLKSGQYEKAIAQLQEARKADRSNAYTTFYLAMAHEKNGRLQDAAYLYEELLDTIPDYAKLYYQLANVKGSLGKQEEGFYYYGYYYFYEGKLEKAKQHFSKALSLMTQDSPMKSNARNMLKKIASFEKEN
ncbi:M48 family metalloprotease [Thermodesulfobacteriota bacterium]